MISFCHCLNTVIHLFQYPSFSLSRYFMGILYQTESFLTACISLVHEPDKPWSKQKLSCTNSRKELRRNCSPIGHNNTKHFLCPIRSRHPLEFLEIARWESVPRGSFALTWKLSSRPFSRPAWLSLGLRGWTWVRDACVFTQTTFGYTVQLPEFISFCFRITF